MTWWETGAVVTATGLKAVCYCRNSAEIGQDNLCDIHIEKIRDFAEKNGIEIEVRGVNEPEEKFIVTEAELKFMVEKLNEYIKKYPKRRKSHKNPEASDELIQRLINDSEFYNETLFDLIKQRRNKK